MDALSTSPGDLLSMRLAVLRELAHSMEASRFALAHNDAEVIVRGAERQADLCRQWSLLEEQLRLKSQRQSPVSTGEQSGLSSSSGHPSSQIEEEFAVLTARINHLTRVHCSLLRHLQRSLAILGHLMDGCSTTYTAGLNVAHTEARPQAGD